MLSFVNTLLFAAFSLVSPADGETVSLLRPDHKEYLSLSEKDRLKRLDDAPYRHRLVRAGHVQPVVKLCWRETEATASEASGEILVTVTPDAGVQQVFALTNATCAYITNLELGRTYTWRVRRAGSFDAVQAVFRTEDQPPRLLRIDGVVNARDLGGWVGRGGRRVRQGFLIRSGGFRGSAFNKDKSIFATQFEDGGTYVTAAGLAALRDDLKIRTDIELRGPMETALMTSSVLGPQVRWVKESFTAYNFIDNIIRGREPFARLFRRLLDKSAYPVSFHCAGGRDRTGTFSFLLLGLLGVSDGDLCRDWEASIFSEENTEFGSARIGRLLDYLHALGGETLAEDCEIYARSCGVTDEEIAQFRDILLEGGAK